MTFEVAKTVKATLNDTVYCKLNYTHNFVVYDEYSSDMYQCLEKFEGGLLDSLENLVKENNIVEPIEATAFIDDDDAYIYVDAMDLIYPLAIIPVGNNEKYKLCIINSIY